MRMKIWQIQSTIGANSTLVALIHLEIKFAQLSQPAGSALSSAYILRHACMHTFMHTCMLTSILAHTHTYIYIHARMHI